MTPKLGLCCISLALQERGQSFQTMTYKRFSQLGEDTAIKQLSGKILSNLELSGAIINYCSKVNISGYRLSSGIAPLLCHPNINLKLKDLPNYSDIRACAAKVSQTIKSTGVRISAHPSEYISLTSENEFTIQNSIRDLEAHGEIFDLLDLPRNYTSPLNIHCRKDGDPEEISGAFCGNFEQLSDSVKSRLVVENNDNVGGVWHISNLLKYFNKKIGIPVTFDVLHHKFCHGGMWEREAFDLAYNSWNTVPIFHYSEGVDGTRKHADWPTGRPNTFDKDAYWDVELKMKDYAVLKILEMP